MSKLNCPCGWQISNVCSHSPEIKYLVSDYEMEEKELTLELVTTDFWECSKCGRVAIGNNTVQWYKKDNL